MAINSTTADVAPWVPDQTTAREVSVGEQLAAVARTVLEPLASLRLTVTLFALSILLVFVATLAQDEMNMWEVIHYFFYSWVTWIRFQEFLPSTWFPNWQNVPGGFWFPGGAAIGSLMVLNLLAAHALRFRVQARGMQLWSGLVVTAVGLVVTTLVILSGHRTDGLQGEPPFSWAMLWYVIKYSLLTVWLALVAATATRPKEQTTQRVMLGVLSALVGAGVVGMFTHWDPLSDSAMRVLWQLLKGGLSAAVLLTGFILLFNKRGGVVLIHAGVLLLMFGQLVVSQMDVEERMMIGEGETINYARDIRSVELALVDPTPADHELEYAVPLTEEGVATRYLNSRLVPAMEDLPFGFEIVEYFRNAQLVPARQARDNPATAGHGRELVAQPRRGGSGADATGRVDMAAAYVRVVDRDGRDHGTYMLSQELSSQDIVDTLTVDGKTYELSLRFKRNYKPYSIKLLDVQKNDYIGTTMPQDYSSHIQLIDPTRNVDRHIHIWMNNPLRYAGETFYQSSYFVDSRGREYTDLQVVQNTGWLIPYVACMVVVLGMIAHFLITVVRFIMRLTGWNRYESGSPGAASAAAGGAGPYRAPAARAAPPKIPSQPSWTIAELVVPALAVSLLLAATVAHVRPKPDQPGTMDLERFGQLPVVHEGRVKPFDSLARSSLRMISQRESFVDSQGNRQPAIRWLMDVITQTPAGDEHRVFRVDDPDLLDLLGLERRKGYLYSVNELRGRIVDFEEQVHQARENREDPNLSRFHRKVLELDRRIRVYTLLAASFQPPRLPELPTPQEFEQDHMAAVRKLQQFREAWDQAVRTLDSMQPPRAIPLPGEDEQSPIGKQWEPYANAWISAYVQARVLGDDPDEATLAMNGMLVSYAQGDVDTFNRELIGYERFLERVQPKRLDLSKTRFESFFNRVSPFVFCAMLYVVGFLVTLTSMTLASWPKWYRTLNHTAFWMIAFIFVLHTAALIGRMYISGRPPVTNLYGSAILVGWGCVLLGLILEGVYRLSIGNLVATASGFMTLMIAYFLAADGDTFTVLQAVLDTQFWLATHVVIIILGYSAVYVAGLLGVVYVLGGLFTRSMQGDLGKILTRMMYGVLCFAILFSFFGTVLGGLWADDSWGRFWGWDPKENGALIIVLWVALILHARWAGMVKDRGLAVLAIGGNIVTSWSWFGVNELGIGLHSYGFTEGRLMWLGLFALSQLALITIGAAVPLRYWLSFRKK